MKLHSLECTLYPKGWLTLMDYFPVKTKGVCSTPIVIENLSEARKDGVYGVGKSGGVRQLKDFGIRPHHQGAGRIK